MVDLPGIYSLTPYSEEERVARNMLWKENPDLIVNVVDSSNLERNLYLTLQLMEFGIPVVLNLNMQDLALAKGWKIDTKKLSQTMGLPVVETVGHQNKGFDELIKSVKVALGASQRVSQTAHFSDSVNRAWISWKRSFPKRVLRALRVGWLSSSWKVIRISNKRSPTQKSSKPPGNW